MQGRISLALIIVFIAFLNSNAYGQFMIGIKYFGLTAHLKRSPHPHLYKLRLDRKGTWVPTNGIVITAEVYVYKNIVSLKAGQCIFSDCALKFAGFTHAGVRVHAYTGNSRFSIGNGPTWYYRKSWNDIGGYVDEGLFLNKGKYQTRFFWYAGEMEYLHRDQDYNGYSVSLFPGPPEFISIAPGYQFVPEIH